MNEDWLPGPAHNDPDPQTLAGLLELLAAQAALLVSVATGGPKIDEVNSKYVRRRRKLDAALRARGIDPPFPYDDLWAWYGHYSQHIAGYAPRRVFISGQAAPARAAIEAALDGVQVSDPGGGNRRAGPRSMRVSRESQANCATPDRWTISRT